MVADSTITPPVQEPMPASHFPKRKRRGSYLTVTGKFPSTKNPHMVLFEGLRERDLCLLLDFDHSVRSFESHAVKIIYRRDGKKYRYTPDMLVTFKPAPDGTQQRRPELCEVKVRKHLRKDWAKFRPRFRAAQAYCRERHWRFRVIDERTLRRPLMQKLHFLRGFRQRTALPEIESTIQTILQKNSCISAEKLAEAVKAASGAEFGEALAQVWRMVAIGKVSINFDQPLNNNSEILLQPWSLDTVVTRKKFPKSDEEVLDEAVESHATSLGTAGSDVLPLEVGGVYALHGQPGQYILVQFEDPETVVVREKGSDVLQTLASRDLAPLVEQKTNRRADLAALTSEQRELAEKRLSAITPFLNQRRVSKADAASEAAKCGVAPKTWRQWLTDYQRNPTLASLLRKPRSDRGDLRLNPIVEGLVKHYMDQWLASSDRMKLAHRNLKNEIERRNRENPQGEQLICPSYGTFYNRCNALSEFERSTKRDGKRLAKLTHGLARGSIGGVDCPLAIIQIDHTEIPVMVIDEEFGEPIGKPWITVLIDLFSRMVIGYYLTLESPGNLSTGMAISNAILPKNEWLTRLGVKAPWPCSGLMRVLHADNAGEFHGNMLELGASAYSIELQLRRVKNPNYGGYIEGYLGTLSDGLRNLPGATLGGPEELGDRKPEKEAVLTMAQLEFQVASLIVEYHQSPHSGLHGQAPIHRWRDGFRGSSTSPGLGSVHIPKDITKLRIDFLPLEERTIGPKGIVWDHIHYSDPALQRWVNARDPNSKRLARRFLCRRDPRDLSRIYFWDPDRQEYLAIRYRNLARPAITLWEHRAVLALLRKRHVSEINEDVIFEMRDERRRRLEEAKTKAAQQRRARDRERDRQASAQATVILGDPAPVVAPAQPPASAPEAVEPFEDFFG